MTFPLLYSEIGPNIQKGIVALTPTFIHRVLVFSISGTYIVDLKDSTNPAAKLSTRLLPDYLADLLTTLVKMTKRSRVDGSKPPNHAGIAYTMAEEPDFKSKDSFQNHMSLKLFNLMVSLPSF